MKSGAEYCPDGRKHKFEPLVGRVGVAESGSIDAAVAAAKSAGNFERCKYCEKTIVAVG